MASLSSFDRTWMPLCVHTECHELHTAIRSKVPGRAVKTKTVGTTRAHKDIVSLQYTYFKLCWTSEGRREGARAPILYPKRHSISSTWYKTNVFLIQFSKRDTGGAPIHIKLQHDQSHQVSRPLSGHPDIATCTFLNVENGTDL